MSIANGFAPGVTWRLQANKASDADTLVGMNRDNAYGLYCQCNEDSHTHVKDFKRFQIETCLISLSLFP